MSKVNYTEAFINDIDEMIELRAKFDADVEKYLIDNYNIAKGHTTSKDIFDAFKKEFKNLNLKQYTLLSAIVDAALFNRTIQKSIESNYYNDAVKTVSETWFDNLDCD